MKYTKYTHEFLSWACVEFKLAHSLRALTIECGWSGDAAQKRSRCGYTIPFLLWFQDKLLINKLLGKVEADRSIHMEDLLQEYKLTLNDKK